jgi:hypothetical protein
MPRFVPVGKGTDQAHKYKKNQMICKTKYKKYEYQIRTIGEAIPAPLVYRCYVFETDISLVK